QVMPVGGPLPPVPPGNTRGCNGSAPQRYHPLTLASWYGYLPVLHRGWQTLNCKVSSRIDERGIYSTQAQLFDSSIHRHALSNPSKVQPDSWRQDNAPALLVYLDISPCPSGLACKDAPGRDRWQFLKRAVIP